MEDLKHTAFLVSAQGHLIQKGCGALKPDEKSIKSVLESRFMKSLVAEAALINGRISDIDYLLDWIKIYGCWKEFERLWSIILRSLPNVETAQTQLYEELKKKYHDPSNLNHLPIRSIEHIFRYNELIQVRDQRRAKLGPPERWHEE